MTLQPMATMGHAGAAMNPTLRPLALCALGAALVHCSQASTADVDASGPLDGGVDTGEASDAGDAPDSQLPALLWEYHKPNGSPNLRSTMAISNNGSHVFTGGWFGGGKLFKIAGGDGSPAWEVDKPGAFGVAAAKASDVLYSAWDRREDNGTLVAFEVSQYSSASATPVWTYNGLARGYVQHSIDSQGLMATSADGGVLAVAAITQKENASVILFFHKGESQPYAGHTLPSTARQIRMSDDGAVLVVHYGSDVRRIDTKSATEVTTVSVGSGTDCLGVSADAAVFVHGFLKLKAYKWSVSSYELQWDYALDGKSSAGAAAVADDNDSIIAAWHKSTTSQEGAVTRFSLRQGNVPTWRYDLKPDTSKTGQSAAWAAISNTGAWSAISWWGTEHNVEPEIMIFRDEAPTAPTFGIDLPGSGLAVGMTRDGRYLAAVGKGVHANESGNGGSVVAAEIHR
jgi:hypothetical protein